MKDMYLKGYSVTDIAKTCGVTRQTVYKKKSKDKKEGVDWDTLALAKNRDISNIKKSEEEFILTLIDSFDRAFEEVKNLEPQERLKILKEYSHSYYRLKAPIKTDVKAQILSAVQNAINEIADIAQKAKNDHVTDFLASNADIILQRVLKA